MIAETEAREVGVRGEAASLERDPIRRAVEAVSPGDPIHRRFFLGAIAVVLTAGGTWGAWLLWKIGFAGTFTGTNSIQAVNAHGQAQIYGWVGLFIIGFACQVFPRLWGTKLAWPRAAGMIFVLMLTGIAVRSLGMPLHASWGFAAPSAVLGSALEIVAILLFAAQMVATFRRGEAKLEPYAGFIFASLFWFVAMSVLDAWHTWATMSAVTRDDLLWHVATYQAPLRDMQIHGLALLMILGVSLPMLPGLYGVPRTSDRRAWSALGVLMTAVVAEVGVFVAYRWTGNHWLAAGLMVPWLMLAGGVALVAWPWKLWRPFPERDRSTKFIRASYLWLAASLAMLLLLPVYQAYYTARVADSIGFSHAYYGAIRHAITVGFISLMIMGFAARVVPTLNGLDPRRLSSLRGPFLLINAGCFLRVIMQTLTDWYPGVYGVIGISGVLEVTALAWWGISLVRTMTSPEARTAGGLSRRGAAHTDARAPMSVGSQFLSTKARQ